MDETRSAREREEALPEHELDDARTVGGGVMGAGGTAIDRGTGRVGPRTAPNDEGADARDLVRDEEDVPMGIAPGTSAGGAQTYVDAIVADDDNRGDDDIVAPDA